MAVKVLEVELSEELAPIPLSDAYDSFRILVRVKRQPVGWLLIPSAKQSVMTVPQLHEEIQKQISWQVVSEVFANLFDINDNNFQVPTEYITVIVCTRNRTKSLATCLNSLLNLSYKNFEILIVDNAPSNDDTYDLVRNLNVRYIREDRPGLDWARNRGIEEAKYSLVAFTDDDVSVDPYWLQSIVKEFMNPKVMAVTGYVAPAQLETPAQTLFELNYGGMGHGFYRRVIKNEQISEHDIIRASNFGIGANMAFRREVFDIIGKFDVALDVGTPSGGGGDVEIFHRLVRGGQMLVYEPSILVWHSHRESLADLKKQIFNNGRSFGCYLITCFNKRTVRRKSLLKFLLFTWFYRWNLRNIVKSHLPKDLTFTELYGMLTSPIAYRKSQEHSKKIAAMKPFE
jgi:glycosyltransferase involved in cell wall biosynthesis